MAEKSYCEDLQKQIRELEQRLSESSNVINRLKNTDHLYKSIFNAANDAIVITDSINGRILHVNQKMLEMFGYTYDEALHLDFQTMSEDVPPYGKTGVNEYFRKAASGSAQLFEWKAKHKNGKLFWAEMNLELVVLEGTDRILANLRDINKRKMAEEELRESEEKFRTLTELSHVGTFLTDPDGKATYVNSRCAEIVGVPVDKALSFDWVQYLHPDDSDRVVNEWVKAVENKKSFKQEYRYVHSDGKVVWTRGETTPVRNEQGEVSVFIGTMVDITALKQAEKELRQNEALFRELFDNIEIGVAIYETQDDAQSFVLRELNLYGLEKGKVKKRDVIGCEVRDVFPGIVALGLFEIFQKVWKTGKPQRHTSSLYQDDTITLWVENYVSRLPSNQLVAIYEDVTDKRQAKIEKETLEKQLAQVQKMESIGHLAGGVAHDFNNMLAVILGHTELALLQADENHDLYTDLKEIQKAAKHSADITKQLLAFARKQTISPKKIDLNDTVERMLNMLRRLIGEDIDLVWKPDTRIWPVIMDPTQIDQILTNLCVNARDAINGVGRTIIETGIKKFDEEDCNEHPGFIPGDFVMLTVSDNGCGMDKNTLDNLFEPFYTTKDIGKGTGLGLATVYGIVKQNNGFVNVYSEPGHGSTFKIYLPRLFADEDVDEVVPHEKSAAGGTETILLVEDEPSILSMTRTMLEQKGYTVLPSGSPGEAMEKAKNHSNGIDLIMTDVVMPGMNGRDLAGHIAVLYPGIRLLFMSGYTANVIAHQGILDDGVVFIQKPFSMEDLAKKLREVLDMAPR